MSLGLFSIGGTLAVVGAEGLPPPCVLAPLVEGALDRGAALGPLMDACG